MKKLTWIQFAILSLIIILLSLFIIGIVFGADNIPYKEVALKIYKLPYNEHTFNCLIKSQMFCEFLKSKGIEAEVIIGYFGKNKFYRHAWILYFYNNEWRIIDLTDNPRSWGFKKANYNWLKEE